MNKAVQFYADVLKGINVDTTEEGALMKTLPDGKVQAIKDVATGMPYALPTNTLLRNKLNDYTFFNPLSEHLNRGESKVIQAFRGWVVFHYCELAQAMALELMQAAASLDVQKSMNNKQAAYLKMVGEADQKTVDALGKVIRSTDKAPSRRFLTIYMSQATDIKQSWLRQANLSFPVLDGDDDEAPFETKGLRKSDIRAIRGMMKYIYGTLWEMASTSDKSQVEIGSGNQVAPYFDSLIQTILQLSQLFKSKATLHRKVLTKELYDKCNVSLDWAELLGNYSDYRKMIPIVDNEDDESVVSAPTPKPQATNPAWAFQASGNTPTPPPVQQPQYQQQRPQFQQPAPRTGTKSLADFNTERQQRAQEQARQQHDPYRQQQPGYQQPGMSPQQAMFAAHQQPQYQNAYGYNNMGFQQQQQPGFGYQQQQFQQQQFQQQQMGGHRPGTLSF